MSKVKFLALTEHGQRHEIGKYIKSKPWQTGLISEAIAEHEDADLIRAAFLCGDFKRFGDMADGAIREYVGKIIDRDKGWRIEE